MSLFKKFLNIILKNDLIDFISRKEKKTKQKQNFEIKKN